MGLSRGCSECPRNLLHPAVLIFVVMAVRRNVTLAVFHFPDLKDEPNYQIMTPAPQDEMGLSTCLRYCHLPLFQQAGPAYPVCPQVNSHISCTQKI